MKRPFVLLFVAVFVQTAAVHANLLSNPGFEDPLGPDNWSCWGNADIETWFSPPEGNNAAYLKGDWAYCSDNAGISQVTAPGSIQGNTPYTLTASFYKNDGWSSVQQYVKIEFIDACGTVVGGATNKLPCLPTDIWVEREVSASAPAQSSYARVTFEAVDPGSCGSLGADNFSLLAVPEPSTLVLAGLLGSFCVWLRRTIQRKV